MKKVVITGATSFIGIHLIEEWLKFECEIFAIIRPNSSNAYRIPKDERICIVELNMNDYSKIPFEIDSADIFYHFAWDGVRAPLRDNHYLQKNNYSCAIQAIEAAYKIGCSVFIGAGSQAEYGMMEGLVDENYPCRPITEYGKEKLHAYMDLGQMATQYAMRFIWVRIFSLYGQYDYSQSLIMSVLAKMKNDESVEMTKGIQKWDYLYVKDAAIAMRMLAEKECPSGVYNLASGDIRPLRSYVIDMRSALGSNSELRFGAIPYSESGPVSILPNINKIQEAINWKSQTTFIEGVKEIIECS